MSKYYHRVPASQLRQGDIFRPRYEYPLGHQHEFYCFDRRTPETPVSKGWVVLRVNDNEYLELPRHHPCDVFKEGVRV